MVSGEPTEPNIPFVMNSTKLLRIEEIVSIRNALPKRSHLSNSKLMEQKHWTNDDDPKTLNFPAFWMGSFQTRHSLSYEGKAWNDSLRNCQDFLKYWQKIAQHRIMWPTCCEKCRVNTAKGGALEITVPRSTNSSEHVLIPPTARNDHPFRTNAWQCTENEQWYYPSPWRYVCLLYLLQILH